MVAESVAIVVFGVIERSGAGRRTCAGSGFSFLEDISGIAHYVSGIRGMSAFVGTFATGVNSMHVVIAGRLCARRLRSTI